MVYCVKELFSRMAGALKNLDPQNSVCYFFQALVFYVPDRNVFGIAWILDRSIEIYYYCSAGCSINLEEAWAKIQ
jgi:hypothetical protein